MTKRLTRCLAELTGRAGGNARDTAEMNGHQPAGPLSRYHMVLIYNPVTTAADYKVLFFANRVVFFHSLSAVQHNEWKNTTQLLYIL